MRKIIQVGTFKATCLRTLEEVNKSKYSVTITKHKKPIARIEPIEVESCTVFGRMKGSVLVQGDLISPIDEGWNADL